MLYRFAGHSPSIGKATYVGAPAGVIGNVVIGDGAVIGYRNQGGGTPWAILKN